ncbi:thioredoxin domain-containing protein [Flavobacterium branchiophilum NBRC 15030 = ATCC 35035]|uniref:Spermatogenesis-associated protein 20-like TRX domain-containing protein n=1 Tax=Flavobacterium branchiophilum TaxID=55197 RepID=A0A543G4E6_9FLAO|nr:thioredoxin domain-containing protein [Flavobacterium branchiophilum]OXA71954.1 thioredoxin domain-containing protein [Flavobacterium branchiophilum NBRC 15030 = ATCC 35035]TQM40972.1 hypothetical protein BC670_1901 [Flavobacterium branchiophilum]GEM54785.1 thioredoxin [Flavobacterium branchiophilum NBRC 15030 = ATCC 35035]
MSNLLHLESSPYLLQHAQNPIHWNAWNNHALQKAINENKLMIVSIGYSACHWCHVMEHESFENLEVAQVMNSHFVNIKIDREERPDLDALYMKALQIMTGQGGWPLNMVCLPDGRPVWGGTYFRKEDWTTALKQIQEVFENQPERMLDYAEKLQKGIDTIGFKPQLHDDLVFSKKTLEDLITKWKRSFDLDFGGMARAPKFMMPNNYVLLLRYADQNQDEELLDFVHLTLTKMAYGGLFDVLGGGFSRYSVDMKWHVPHFEKMQYDNAQLLFLYAQAFQKTGEPLYQEVVEKTIQFIEKEWFTDNKSFCAAFDADSINSQNVLEEGTFYVWTQDELIALLGDDYGLFSKIFNINEFGHWEHGHYVLIQNQSLAYWAEKESIDLAVLKNKKQEWEQKLYQKRQQRPKPRLDNKVITSWNALTIKGLVEAYKTFGTKKYLQMALQNAQFIAHTLWSPDGHLWHIYQNGTCKINGFLEDYAFVIEAFIHIYEVTFDEDWLLKAKTLTDYTFDYFFDTSKQMFRFNSRKDPELIAQHFEIEDNVIPSSNSVMAHNLNYLSLAFDNLYYQKTAHNMLLQATANVDYPSAFSNWLWLQMDNLYFTSEMVLNSENAVVEASEIHRHYNPENRIFGCFDQSKIPYLKDKTSNKSMYYFCKNKECHLPVTDFQLLKKKLMECL